MDTKMDELMERLEVEMANILDGQVNGLIQEAWEAALAEAKAMMRAKMLQAILERAICQMGGASEETAYPAEIAKGVSIEEGPRLAMLSQADPAECKKEVQGEIEAIRRKIAENESLLNRMKSPNGAPKGEECPIRSEGEVGEGPGGKGCGYYIYGIVEGSDNLPLEGLPEEGIDPTHGVYTLPYQSLRAIVSQVPLAEFGQEELEANLSNPAWLEAKVRAHQRVLEAASASHTPIPMKFGTIYRSQVRLEEMLAEHYGHFLRTLARLDGKQEWGVKLYFCQSQTLAQRIAEESDRVKRLKAEMAGKPSGMAYFLGKRLEEILFEEIGRTKDECAQDSHERLAKYAEEAVINPLVGKDIGNTPGEMLLNGAYLVAPEQLCGFQAELECLEGKHGGLGFRYELSGPWPPYNFVTMDQEGKVAHA